MTRARRQSHDHAEGPPTIRLLIGYIAMLALVLVLTLIQNAIHHHRGVASNGNSAELSSSSLLSHQAKQPEGTAWPSLFHSNASRHPQSSTLRRFNQTVNQFRTSVIDAQFPETCTMLHCTDCTNHHIKSHDEQALSTSQQAYHPPSHTLTTSTFAVELCCVMLIVAALISVVPHSQIKTLCLLLCLLFALNVPRHASLCFADYMELGYFSSCAFLTSQNNAVKCFGSNSRGELGQEDNSSRGNAPYTMGIHLAAIDFGSGFQANFLSPSIGAHRCVISDTNETKCFGFNLDGQLGYGDTLNRGDTVESMGDFLLPLDLGDGFVAQQVVCGVSHTCALSTAHSVKCWGWARDGQLGYGDAVTRGDEAGEMGNNLDVVDLGTEFVAIGIAAGAVHTCSWSLSGAAKCFGMNLYGELGQGDTERRGLSAGQMGDNLTAIDLGSTFTVVQVCAGFHHSCALSSAGAVTCFGDNTYGQLGIESTDNIGDTAGEMGENLQVVDLGENFTTIAIACGWDHNCALSNTRSIKCWGENSYGQLGYGDTATRGAISNTMGAFLDAVDVGSDFIPKEVKCGPSYTCTTSEDDQMKCWGKNSDGQLGYEDTVTRGYTVDQMGDNLDAIDLLAYTLAPTLLPTQSPASPTSFPFQSPTTSPTEAPVFISTAPPDESISAPHSAHKFLSATVCVLLYMVC